MDFIETDKKKLVFAFSVLFFLLFGFCTSAAISSLDFEKSSNQYANLANASQTGLNITGDMTVEIMLCTTPSKTVPKVVGIVEVE